MSALLALTHEVAVLAHHASVQAAADEGIIDTLTAMNSRTQTLLRATSVTVAIGAVIYNAIHSHLNASRIMISILISGLLLWGVFSITDVRDRVDKEINSGSKPAAAAQLTPSDAQPLPGPALA